MSSTPLSRRGFLGVSLTAGAGLVTGRGGVWTPADGAPAVIPSPRLRPLLPSGVQSGDPRPQGAVVWSRADRPARMWVDWAMNDAFRDARTVRGPAALEDGAFTAALDLAGLPPGERVAYRVRFESLAHPGTFSEPLVGHLRTPPRGVPRGPRERRRPAGRGGRGAPGAARGLRPVRIAWGGDVVGQGWGIDDARGGLRIFGAIRRAEPDVFVHSGDIIYADQPLEPEVLLDDGTVWRNVVTDAKAKVAETLDDFRGCFAYNLMDPSARALGASVPMVAQWDDHEVVNNWFPGLRLDEDDRYTVKSASLLAARARRALGEFVPLRRHPTDAERVYRRFAWGPLVEVFVLDLRAYRGANTPNRQAELGPDARLLGAAQARWLRDALRVSTATWKVIASDMPVGLLVPDRPRDGERTWEAWANGDDGPPLGRELELAHLLRFIKRERIRNTVWITADVHYAAAHHYAPERAAFPDFDPFWEFVGGPMHAGTFGPNALDRTFGPEVRFSSVGDGVEPNRPPSADLQFFGTLDIDPATRVLTAGIVDVTGRRVYEVELEAAE